MGTVLEHNNTIFRLLMYKPTTISSKRSGALDLLRFVAVLIVFFGHYTDTFNYIYRIVPENLKYSPVSKYASLALLIFFMVSGYVVTMTSIKKGIKEFIVTRLSRLYPLFWVSCLIAFILPRLPFLNHSYLAYSTFKEFLVNLTMIPSVFGYAMINPVFHTLLIELVFYFFIATIIIFKWWNKIITVISVMLILSVASLFKEDMPVHIIITPFLGGMIFYLISINYASKLKLYSLLSVNFFCALMSARPLAQQLDVFYKVAGSHNVWIMMFIITLIYISFLLISLKTITIRSRPSLQLLGEIAYPFYLFHIYFLCFYYYFRNSIQADLLLYGILLAAIVSSWLINILIEKPCSKLASKVLYFIFRIFEKRSKKEDYDKIDLLKVP